MNFIDSLHEVFPVIGRDIKNILLAVGDVNNLNTASKEVVGAINELILTIQEYAKIVDSAVTGTDVTYSIDKIRSLIDAAKTDIKGGVSIDYDTLSKIADKLVELESYIFRTDADLELATDKPNLGLVAGDSQQDFNNEVDTAIGDLRDNKANADLSNVIAPTIPDWSLIIGNNTNF